MTRLTSKAVQRVLNVLFTMAALLIAAMMLRREFGPVVRSDLPKQGPPRYVQNWEQALQHALIIGDRSAPLKLVEFSDLECPYCARFHRQTWPRLQSRFGSQIALVFVHFPLPQHRLARPAALAAECADRQGRFAQFVDAVFERHDSLGHLEWRDYARYAGVENIQEFYRCMRGGSGAKARIDSGVALAARLGVAATPGIMVNGWLFEMPPGDSLLLGMVASLLQSGRP